MSSKSKYISKPISTKKVFRNGKKKRKKKHIFYYKYFIAFAEIGNPLRCKKPFCALKKESAHSVEKVCV